MPIELKPFFEQGPSYKGGKSKEEILEMTDHKTIYKLSSNENPLGPSPLAMEAIKQGLLEISEYPERSNKRLSKALASYYNDELHEDQFITTNSGVANIDLIVQAFAEKDAEFIYSSPGFGPYKGFPKKYGAIAVDVPLIGDNFTLNVQGILDRINSRTKAIFITSPNNPTGTIIPHETVDELLDELPGHVVLVFDEVYFQYVDDAQYVRALPYVKAGKNVIAVNSFSKAYGLAGLRVGYSYSTPKLAEYLKNFRRPFMINTLSMKAAIAALNDKDFLKQTVDWVWKEKEFIYQKLTEQGIKFWKTQANFILVQVPIPVKQMEKEMLSFGVMIRPQSAKAIENCIRVSIGTREGNQAFVQALSQILSN